MKRLISILLSLTLIISFVACSSDEEKETLSDMNSQLSTILEHDQYGRVIKETTCLGESNVVIKEFTYFEGSPKVTISLYTESTDKKAFAETTHTMAHENNFVTITKCSVDPGFAEINEIKESNADGSYCIYFEFENGNFVNLYSEQSQ